MPLKRFALANGFEYHLDSYSGKLLNYISDYVVSISGPRFGHTFNTMITECRPCCSIHKLFYSVHGRILCFHTCMAIYRVLELNHIPETLMSSNNPLGD